MSLRHAISIAQSQTANSLHLPAALDLALLLEKLDNSSEAINVLDGIYGKFVEGFDARDLTSAQGVLQNLKISSKTL